MTKIQDFTLSVNLLEALLWQYNDAEKLKTILQNNQDWYNENIVTFFNDWYTNVFNVDTANDFGLSVWAKILDVNFAKEIPERTDNKIWGFGQYRQNFSNGNFKPPKDENYVLSLEQKRLIIKLTYQKYHTLPSVPEINKIIRALINEDSYIVDGFDMSTNLIIFKEQIPRDTQFILDNFDILPRPAGVGVKTRVITGREFGFGEFRNNFSTNSFFGKKL